MFKLLKLFTFIGITLNRKIKERDLLFLYSRQRSMGLRVDSNQH